MLVTRQAINLLRLLGSGGARDVAANVSGLVALAYQTLDGLPTLTDLGRGALVGDGSIGTSSNLAYGRLNKRALGVAGAEESKVDTQQDPATLGEGKGSQQ